MERFDSWFEENNLTLYKQLFVENGYDDLEVIAEITDDELREIGVSLAGHRKKILLKALYLRKKIKMDEAGSQSPRNNEKDGKRRDEEVSLPSTSSSFAFSSSKGKSLDDHIEEPCAASAPSGLACVKDEDVSLSSTPEPASTSLFSTISSSEGPNTLDDADIAEPEAGCSSFPHDSLGDNKRRQSPFAKWLQGPQRKQLRMFQNAAQRKVKLYSNKEIADAKGLEKIRRKFWNEKAEELCQDKALKKWKATAIHGVVDTAWTLKKTAVLVVEAKNVQEEELDLVAFDSGKKGKQKAGTIEGNVQRTLTSHRELLNVNERLRTLNDSRNTTANKKEKIQETECAAKTALGELRMAQESLRKALQNKRKDITSSSSPFATVPEEVINDCSEPTSEDIDGMMNAVLTRTRPPKDEVDEEEDLD